jgi:hypothetical protein
MRILALLLCLAAPASAQGLGSVWLPTRDAPRPAEEVAEILRAVDDGAILVAAAEDAAQGLDVRPALRVAQADRATRAALLDSLDAALARLRAAVATVAAERDSLRAALDAVPSDTAERIAAARAEGLALGRATGIELGRAQARAELLDAVNELIRALGADEVGPSAPPTRQ